MKWIDVMRFARQGNPDPPRRVEKTEAEWKAQLTPEEYHITRQKGTERAFTGKYCELHVAGLYGCKCCGTLLFDSTQQFKSGTGWPSFFQSLPNAIGTKEDRKFIFQVRTEVHCRRCGSHLGHVFDDGPEPTGKRHCLNGLSLTFDPAA